MNCAHGSTSWICTYCDAEDLSGPKQDFERSVYEMADKQDVSPTPSMRDRFLLADRLRVAAQDKSVRMDSELHAILIESADALDAPRSERSATAAGEASSSNIRGAMESGALTPLSAIEPTPTRGAVLLLDGKAYRMCACRSDTPLCPKGRERKCPSAGYDHCLIPVCSTHGIFIDVMGCKQCDPEYP